MAIRHRFKGGLFACRAGILVVSATLLGACITPQLPLSDESVLILDLHCGADRSVVATALARVPGTILETGGAILHSPDQGLTWSLAKGGEALKDVVPRFFSDPRNAPAGTSSLIVTGYKSSSLIEWTYHLAGWMQSADSGRTWNITSERLPAVGSRDPLAWPPPLVEINADGRLATLRRAPSPVLLISDNGGATWSESSLPEIDATIYHLRSNGRGRLIVVGATAPKILGPSRLVVAQSDDSGKTWSVALSVEADHLACNPRMIGDADGGMLIYNPCPHFGRRYYFSADGGRTWQPRVFFRYAFGAFELVAAIDERRWIALSKEPREHGALFVWVSDDGGNEWRGRKTGFSILSGDPHLYEQSVVVLPDGVVLAYVSNGRVLRSADRGETWHLVDTGLPQDGTYWLGASCTDGNGLVVLGGGQGMLVRSLDRGLTWERAQLPSVSASQLTRMSRHLHPVAAAGVDGRRVPELFVKGRSADYQGE